MTIDPKNNIEVFESAEDLSKATAEFILELANEAVEEERRFSISLSGGSTPENLFALLATPEYRDRMPWADTFVFWGDERYVPMNDKRNNAHAALELLLSKVDLPVANIFPVPVNISPAAKAAKAYEKSIKEFFGDEPPRFDLVLLGIGENAHTASLFPHTPVIHDEKDLVAALYVDEVKMYRITMTAPLINQARHVAFLACGENKAAVIKTVLTSAFEPEKYPAQLISPRHGNLYWLLDKKAASLLS